MSIGLNELRHIEAETKWSKINQMPLCRWHIQIHFLDWKLLNFDSNFTEVCSLSLYDNSSSLLQVMSWCLTAYKPSPEPMLTMFYTATFSNAFFKGKFCIWFKFHWCLFPLPRAQIDNTGKSAMVQILTAWCQKSARPLPEQTKAQFTDTYIHH